MSRTILTLSLFALLACPAVACDAGPASDAPSTVATASAQDAGKTPPKSETPAPEKPAPGTTDKPVPKAEEAKPVAAGAVDPAVAKAREFIGSLKLDKQAKEWKTRLPKPPQLTFDAQKKYSWQLETTEGPIRVRFMPDVAPMHVSSTVYLTEAGFYDDVLFHRVIPGFMAQGGDPLGKGTGGPAYKYAGEFSPNVKHTKPGLLSMANAGPGTDGSQFFLTFVPTPHLDGKHTIFGEIVDGLDNLKKIEKLGSPSGAPSKPIKIVSAKIVVE